MTKFKLPICLEIHKVETCYCGDIYCLIDMYGCQNKTLICNECSESLCLLCYSECEYCNSILCYNCFDHIDSNFCFNKWFDKVGEITFQIINKYNLLEINLKDYILSFINNGKI